MLNIKHRIDQGTGYVIEAIYYAKKKKKKISVDDAAKALKIDEQTIQSLVDFLVEERIFGIEYKFTTPYIYLSKEKKNLSPHTHKKTFISKEEFFERAEKRKLSLGKITELWRQYIDMNMTNIKSEFYIKSHARHLSQSKIEELWGKYLRHLL